MYVLNAFSLNMLAEFPSQVLFKEISLDQVCDILTAGFESAVGHAETASVFTDVLGVTVPVNRASVTLNKGDQAVVGQYRGPRLPEGVTTLPAGATISWYLVTIL